jgi:hypothetical protein
MTGTERDLIKHLTEALERAPWPPAPYYTLSMHPNIIEECKNIEERNQKRRQLIEAAKRYLEY